MTDDRSLIAERAPFGPNPGKHRDDCAWTLDRHTCSCEYPQYLQAVESLALDYIDTAVTHALDEDRPGWEDFPELPEFVWEDVRERVRAIADHPYRYESSAAYDALSKLATEEV